MCAPKSCARLPEPVRTLACWREARRARARRGAAAVSVRPHHRHRSVAPNARRQKRVEAQVLVYQDREQRGASPRPSRGPS